MLRFKGTMYEKLELENYPFDIQRLNLDVISNQSISKFLLVNNNDSNPSIVLKSNFRDSQEWYLHNFVGVEKNFTSSSKYSIDDSVHSKLKFFCVVSRKPGKNITLKLSSSMHTFFHCRIFLLERFLFDFYNFSNEL
jgi:hypothetical protein